MNLKLIFTEYFPVVISMVSLVLSTLHWLYDRNHEKANIAIEERGFLPNIAFSNNREYSVFSIIIKNQSKFDIAITRIFLKYKDEIIEFEWHSNMKTSVFHKELNSTPLPLHIFGLSAYGGYFFLPKNDRVDTCELSNNSFIIEIQTSRGYKKEYRFPKINPKISL